MSSTGPLPAARAAVDIVPRVNGPAIAASISKAVEASMAGLSRAADDGVAARLGAVGSGLSKVGSAFAPVSKAAAGFGAVALASAVQVDNAYATLAQRTGATGAALQSLEQIANRSALSTGASFKQTAADEANLTQRLGATGPVLQGLTTQFENLRYVQGEQAASVDQVSAVLAQFGVPVSQASKYLDEFFVASQKSGVGTADLAAQVQAQGAVLRDSGLDLEQSIALIGTLGKAGIPAQAVMVGLRQEFAKAAKAGEPLNEFFAQTVKQIQDLIHAGDTAGAEGVATKAFGGRGAATIFDAIKQGKLDASDFTAAFAGSAGAINRTASQTETFARDLGKAKEAIELGLKPLGDSILPKVEGGLHAVAAAVGAVSHIGGGIFGDIGGDVLVAAAASSAIFKLGGAIATVSANRAKDLALVQAHIGAVTGNTAVEVAHTAALEAYDQAANHAAAAQARLNSVTAAYGADSAEAGAAAEALAAAETEQAAAASAAAAANSAVGAATAEAAGGTALATAGLGLAVPAVGAFVLGFEGMTKVLHSSGPGFHEANVNAQELAKNIDRLAKTGQNSSFSGAAQGLKRLQDLTGKSLSDLPKFDAALDHAFAGIVQTQGAAAASRAIDAVARSLGVSRAEVLASTSATHEYGDALGDTNRALREQARDAGLASGANLEMHNAAQSLIDVQGASAKADTDLAGARLAVAEASTTFADAQTSLNDILHGYPASSQEAQQATEQYQSALDSQANAVQSVKDAQQSYNDTVKQGIDQVHSLDEALTQARDSAANNADAVANADDKLKELQAKGADHHQIEEAQRALAAAQRAQAEGVTKVADAQQNLADQPAKQAEAEQKASQAIVAAQKAAEKAAKDVATASANLDVVLHGHAATSKEVRDAQDAVARASLGEQTAQENLVPAVQAASNAHFALWKSMSDPKTGSNGALFTEIGMLNDIKKIAPEVGPALDPLIARLEGIVALRQQAQAGGSSGPFGSGTLGPATGAAGGITGGTGVITGRVRRLAAEPPSSAPAPDGSGADHLERLANTMDHVAATLDSTLSLHRKVAARPPAPGATRMTVDPLVAARAAGARI